MITFYKHIKYTQNIARIAKSCPSNISSVVNVLKLFLLKNVHYYYRQVLSQFKFEFCNHLS